MMIEEAEQKGMEVTEAQFRARAIRQARLESRTKVHSFDEMQFTEVVLKGLAAAGEASNQAEEAVDEYYFRRWGLVFASFIITLLAISLYVLLRRIEKSQSSM